MNHWINSIQFPYEPDAGLLSELQALRKLKSFFDLNHFNDLSHLNLSIFLEADLRLKI